MKYVLPVLLALAVPAAASTNLNVWVNKIYNVHYSEVNDHDPNEVVVSVIWYDDDDVNLMNSVDQLCGIDDNIRYVQWGDLGDFLKAHRDVSAATDASYDCKEKRRRY